MSKVSLRRLNQRDNAVKRDLDYLVEMLNKQAMAIYQLDERIAKLERPEITITQLTKLKFTEEVA